MAGVPVAGFPVVAAGAVMEFPVAVAGAVIALTLVAGAWAVGSVKRE